MRITKLIWGVISHFPNVDRDDTFQELSVVVWQLLKARGLEYSEDLEADERLGSLLAVACWHRCVDRYYRFMRAQQRDVERTVSLHDIHPAHEPRGYEILCEQELRDSLDWPEEDAEFLAAFLDGDAEVSRIQQEIIHDGSGCPKRPGQVFARAMMTKFRLNQRAFCRKRRAVEARVLATLGVTSC
jgi:hypothetical protein